MLNRDRAILGVVFAIMLSGLVAFPVLAIDPEGLCIASGGSWHDTGSLVAGLCVLPPGTAEGESYGCKENEAVNVIRWLDDYSYGGHDCFIPISQSSPKLPTCGPIELPRIIEQSFATEIIFRGNELIESAVLSIPGHDGLAISNLTFDAETMTWSGTVNTRYIPADTYKPVRVLVSSESVEQRACHFGGLEVVEAIP